MKIRKPIFPAVKGILHGGDYNPEQWLDRPDILKKDVELMKEAGINSASLGIFSWSVYEPREGEFNFDWLEEIINNLYENGIYTILATPSGARPAWLDAKYPEAMRVDAYGVRNRHGLRHNHCMTSPEYRKKVEIIDGKIAERFANHPGILMWHISNEFGGECYCDLCRKKFQEYLADRYDHNIENLNTAWWTTFWSHRYTSFDQIDPPYSNGENCVLCQTLDWKRFTTENTRDFMKFEIDTVHRFNKDIPVTANFMEIYDGLDYHNMAPELDYMSWDSYPKLHNDYEPVWETALRTAFSHSLFRSMKPDRPFMLMESAPGVVNWQEVNKVRRPGFHKLMGMQAVASGTDTVQYFQIRKSRGSSEQFHGAVIDHMGTNETRVFKEVADLGQVLKNISEVAGSIADNKVALIWDWDNRWAVEDVRYLSQESKKFDDTCIDIWKALMKLGVEADIIPQDGDFSKYKVIIAPMMYLLHDGVGDKIKSFVSDGGQFMATYFTGYVDKSTLCYLGGFPGQGLSEVFGLVSEEIDALYPTDRNSIKPVKEANAKEASRLEVKDYQELIRVKGSEVLAVYENDYVKDEAAITRNTLGKGRAYYVGCRLNASDMEFIFEEMLENAGVEYGKLPVGVEYHSRFAEDNRYDFYLNFSDEAVEIQCRAGLELVTGTKTDSTLKLEGRGVAVVKSK